MSMHNKKNFKEDEVCKMRWYPHRGLPRVSSPVFSPFSYSTTILSHLKNLTDRELVEFMRGTEILFTGTVKQITTVLSHVNAVVSKIDIETMDAADLRSLLRCSPVDFWKSEEIQDIIKRYIK